MVGHGAQFTHTDGSSRSSCPSGIDLLQALPLNPCVIALPIVDVAEEQRRVSANQPRLVSFHRHHHVVAAFHQQFGNERQTGIVRIGRTRNPARPPARRHHRRDDVAATAKHPRHIVSLIGNIL